jgi:PadR family transcriptional regulator PadR
MTEATYYILATLLEGPLHGYGIIKRAGEVSRGRIRLRVGTLYGALERLLEQGLIESEGEEIVDGRARRYYRLSGAGESAVREEARRLRAAADVVDRRRAPVRGAIA